MPISYLRYVPELEQPGDGEAETIDKIIATMRDEGRKTRERYGRAVRTSHAKSHALVRARLEIGTLPPELAQGLFATPGGYDAIVRMAHVPGECLDDRRVSSPRGMAIKILGVEGAMIEGAEGNTQDLLLDSGAKSFPSPGPRMFLATIRQLDMATSLPEAVKGAVSKGARGVNALFKAFGSNSPNMDFFGHTPQHPLAEHYFSQTPYRYGDHVAKFALIPASADLQALNGAKLEIGDDEDALRTDVVGWLRSRPAEYDLCAQLCTDIDRMPIENALTEWDEEESPYRPVARLLIPAQDAAAELTREDQLSFRPANALAAHRPLGGINRARLAAYRVLADERRQANGIDPADTRAAQSWAAS